MSANLLTEFEVRGYRGLDHLRLPTLGRVTLLAGKNDAGKTSTLEALRIHVEPQPVSPLWEILRHRQEYNRFRGAMLRQRSQPIGEGEIAEATRVAESLFYRRANNGFGSAATFTSAGRLTATTRIMLPWAHSGDSRPLEPTVFGSEDDPLVTVERGNAVTSLSLSGFFGYVAPGDDEAVFIGPGGFNGQTISGFWSRAVGLGLAYLVEGAFRSYLPTAKRIHVLSGAQGFFPAVAIEFQGSSRPTPLSELGDGARRVLGIVLAMANTTGGMLLVDEVENGIHHTIQPELWESIFGLSEKLNVQVVATTHSWDAVVGFQYAANRSVSEGVLYRLDRQEDGTVRAVHYTERDVAIAAEQQIEVR
jgi:hypothetical protein